MARGRSGSGGAFTQFFVEAGLVDQDVLDAVAGGGGVESLATHCLVGIEGADDRVH